MNWFIWVVVVVLGLSYTAAIIKTFVVYRREGRSVRQSLLWAPIGALQIFAY